MAFVLTFVIVLVVLGALSALAVRGSGRRRRATVTDDPQPPEA